MKEENNKAGFRPASISCLRTHGQNMHIIFMKPKVGCSRNCSVAGVKVAEVEWHQQKLLVDKCYISYFLPCTGGVAVVCNRMLAAAMGHGKWDFWHLTRATELDNLCYLLALYRGTIDEVQLNSGTKNWKATDAAVSSQTQICNSWKLIAPLYLPTIVVSSSLLIWRKALIFDRRGALESYRKVHLHFKSRGRHALKINAQFW